MTSKDFTIFIDQDEELSFQTRRAFRHPCPSATISDAEIAALPKPWSKRVSFEEGVALLDRVLAHRANAYCATTIEDGEIVSICCNSPLMLLHPVISVRLIRSAKVKTLDSAH
ncbi:MAG: hypothetical protein AAFV49_19130 [Pseudomonadota bacterium]